MMAARVGSPAPATASAGSLAYGGGAAEGPPQAATTGNRRTTAAKTGRMVGGSSRAAAPTEMGGIGRLRNIPARPGTPQETNSVSFC
jgi:hypothetical protein